MKAINCKTDIYFIKSEIEKLNYLNICKVEELNEKINLEAISLFKKIKKNETDPFVIANLVEKELNIKMKFFRIESINLKNKTNKTNIFISCETQYQSIIKSIYEHISENKENSDIQLYLSKELNLISNFKIIIENVIKRCKNSFFILNTNNTIYLQPFILFLKNKKEENILDSKPLFRDCYYSFLTVFPKSDLFCLGDEFFYKKIHSDIFIRILILSLNSFKKNDFNDDVKKLLNNIIKVNIELSLDIINNNEGFFISAMFKAMNDPVIPEFPALPNGDRDSISTYQYYKTHLILLSNLDNLYHLMNQNYQFRDYVL